MSDTAQLRIAHLYAHFLNIYGDRGNIASMVQRSRWRQIEVSVTAIGIGDELPADYFDFFFIGGGQDRQQLVIAKDLQRLRPALTKSVENGAVILSICGGYQLLGRYYQPHDGERLEGISLIDAYTEAGNTRMIGNVVVERPDKTTLVGFENHSGRTFLSKDTQALGRVTTGNGNNGQDGMEGAAQAVGKGKVYGTYLHGSLLPKNPLLADELITYSLKRRYGPITLEPLDDALEIAAHQAATKLRA